MAPFIENIQKVLRYVARAQSKYIVLFSIVLLLFTIFCAVGATQITLQSDLSELDPQDIPVTQLRNKISTEFSEFESVVILVSLDDSSNEVSLNDIRDPSVMEFILEIDSKLREEPSIQDVQSAGVLFQNGVPETLEGVKSTLADFPELSGAFDRGYEWTVVFVEADVGGDDGKIKALNNRIDEILESSTIPGGVKVTTTGDAPLNSAIFTLLISDAFFTLIFATCIIFALVMVLERSFKRAFIIMFPLIIGLIWTSGTMGWLGIPITVATAAMGAMLLGLGVEYAIFFVERYKEERETKPANLALEECSASVGATLMSSGTTTLIGFLSLSLSLFPVLSDLGKTLAIGIAFMLCATIFASPIVILGDEKLFGSKKSKKKKKKEAWNVKLYRSYGRFVSKKPFITLLISFGITGLMFVGIGQIVNQEVDFETILPEDLEEIVAYVTLTDEFGDDSSLLIYVYVDPTVPGSLEPRDIRDPRVLDYVDRLAQKSLTIENVASVSSVVDIAKSRNGGFIPQSITQSIDIFNSISASDFVSRDFGSTLVRISANSDSIEGSREIVRQLKEVVDSTESPAGVSARASGGLVVESELEALNGPDSSRTSGIAFAGIIVVLFFLTRSIKGTVLPLFTVVIGIIWTLGLTGFFGVPFNNITSSVITMIIGIGIDFGLQIINRYNQELPIHGKRKAMEVTLTSILTPMIITVIAALIGFRAMGLGQLKIMNDLGSLMSFGITASMLGAISAVASLVVLFQREIKKDNQEK